MPKTRLDRIKQLRSTKRRKNHNNSVSSTDIEIDPSQNDTDNNTTGSVTGFQVHSRMSPPNEEDEDRKLEDEILDEVSSSIHYNTTNIQYNNAASIMPKLDHKKPPIITSKTTR